MEGDFESIANKILQIDDVMRQVGLVNDKGELVNSMMKGGKTPLLENKKLAEISHDLYVIKSIHEKEFSNRFEITAKGIRTQILFLSYRQFCSFSEFFR